MFHSRLLMSGTSAAGAFTPSTLFALGEQGFWYDPSDFSTLFQDSAGTTPVTAVEQPVGLILDKSGRGNNASQSTSASRPVLSARYNLLTKTEQFDDAAWGKSNVSVTANATTDPFGGSTADKIAENTTSTVSANVSQSVLASGIQYKISVYAKAAERSWLRITFNGTFQYPVWFNLSSGTLGTVTSGATATITSVGNGWYLCTYTAQTGNGPFVIFSVQSADGQNSFARTVGYGLYLWGADARSVTDSSGTIPDYQQIDTSSSYSTSGFPYYLRFDGVDDSLLTSSFSLTGTDKITLWASVRRNSASGALGSVCEFSSTVASNDGSFQVSAPSGSGVQNYGILTRGTSNVTGYLPSGFPSPISNLIVASLNNGGSGGTPANCVSLRINGTANTNTPASTNTSAGNFGDYPLYIGRRNNASGPFNGRIYGLIGRGGSCTTQQITDTETWLRDKSKVY